MGVLSDLVMAFRRTRTRLRDEAASAHDDAEPDAEALPEPAGDSPRSEDEWSSTPAAGYSVSFDPGTVRRFPRLETRAMRVSGVGHYLSFREREVWTERLVILVAEPLNPVDPFAVTIALPDGRKIGYMSAGTAKAYQPLILEAGSIEVRGRAEGRKLWVDVPRLPGLRKAVG